MTDPPRQAPLEMRPDEFREAGHRLVEQIAEFLETTGQRPVTTGESPSTLRALLPDDALPENGTAPQALLDETTQLLFNHSLLNGHPRFWGYITASAAPIGVLGELLAAAINPNVGAWNLSPAATEIEAQTTRWIADLLGFPRDAGGLLVSGGNMANFIGFLAARCSRAPWDVRAAGLHDVNAKPLSVYASQSVHTWIQKAADLFGIGTNNVRWIPTDRDGRMSVTKLNEAITQDRSAGKQPLMAVGTAGTVSTGAIDDLPEIADVCAAHDVWFHIDGAYGALAAVTPDAPAELAGIARADSIAIDPHKWLYAPLEAGCVLVRDAEILQRTFRYRPEYYKFETVRGEPTLNFNEFGPQNSRGFRALKVWLALRHVGRAGYARMIADDIALARRMYDLAKAHAELEAFTHHLSIATFRFVPRGLSRGEPTVERYLDRLNVELLTRLQEGGEAFLSNAVVDGKYLLRACIVNFRSTTADVDALPEIVTRLGGELDSELRPRELEA